jgi:hypothetical protein
MVERSWSGFVVGGCNLESFGHSLRSKVVGRGRGQGLRTKGVI